MGKNKEKSGKSTLRKLVPLALIGIGIWALFVVRNAASIMLGGASTLIHKINLQGMELRTKLIVINPGNLNVDIQNFLGQIYYKGVALGITNMVNNPVRIGPFETKEIEFATQVGWIGAASQFYEQFFDLFRKQNKGQKIALEGFTIRGTLRAENLNIPINQPLLT
jgi:hypothetical protein